MGVESGIKCCGLCSGIESEVVTTHWARGWLSCGGGAGACVLCLQSTSMRGFSLLASEAGYRRFGSRLECRCIGL